MTDDTRSLDQLLDALPVDPAPLATIRHDAATARRRRTLAITGIAAATVIAVTGGVAALSGGLGGEGRTTATDPAAQRELADAGGQPCPAGLPQADGSDGFGTNQPAPGSPQLPVADQGWLCRYGAHLGRPGPDEDGGLATWQRDGQPVALDRAAVEELIAAGTPLEPPDVDVPCPADLGYRWLLVTSNGGDLTGVAVDQYGCRNVRITDSPAHVEPGEATGPGTVPGVLEAPDGFAEALAAAYGAGTPTAIAERLTIEMGHCWVEPVAFDGEQWNVPFDDQFGWGGLEPKNWQGTGVMTRVADDEARFDDDGGSSVTFLLVDDPAVTPVEEAICS